MEFKIPKVPIITGRFGIRQRGSERNYHGCPVTRQNEIDIVKTIGRGSFGVVKLCKKNSKTLILKEMIDHNEDQEKLFVKEAKMLSEIQHQNIVRFDSIVEPVHPDTFGFLMEYVYFDFRYFGQDEKISFLKDFMICMDDIEAKGFEHFPVIIATDITRGLSFLHSRDVVHRDLKPANILVSNQHYTPENLSHVWNTQPIIAKITDFGESRATMVQTASLIHTKTNNISRGTPVFMAPEIHVHDGKSKHDIEDMKGMDIWSLAMIFYLLTNLDKKYPFQEEISELQNAGVSNQNIMFKVFEKQPYPKHGMKYSEHRNSQWKPIANIFDMCVHCSHDQRPTAEKILLMLEGNKRNTERKRERNVFEDFDLSTYDEKACPDQFTEQSESTLELPSSKRAKTEILVRKSDRSLNENVAPSSEKKHQTTTPGMMNTEIEMSSSKLPAASSMKNTSQTESADLGLNERPSNDFCQGKEHTSCYTVIIEEAQMSESQNTEMYTLPPLNTCTSEKGEEPICNVDDENESAIDAAHSDEDDFSVTGRNVTEFSLAGEERSEPNTDYSYDSTDGGKVSVMGDFHQASRQIFKHAAAGSQCSSICLISAVAAETKQPTEWTADDINKILIEGDQIHLQCLKNKEWPYSRVESRLDIDELPHTVNIAFNGKAINANISVLNNLNCGIGQEIRHLLAKSLLTETGGKKKHDFEDSRQVHSCICK